MVNSKKESKNVKKVKLNKKKVNNANKKHNNNVKNKLFEILKEYYLFYKENIKRKHIIIYIIALLIFFIIISFNLNNFSSENSVNEFANQITQIQEQNKAQESLHLKIAKEKLPLPLFIVFAGITPIIPISFVALIYPVQLATNLFLAFTFINNNLKLIPVSIGCIIQMFALALAIATGFYYYILSTKKYRYSNKMGFGIADIKREYYNIRKDKEKLEKLERIQAKKREKTETLNVKVPYKNLAITVIISTLILVIGAVITGF